MNRDPLFLARGEWNDGGTADDPIDDAYAPGNLHLQTSSPAIDAGTMDGAPAGDLEGHGRPCSKGVDIGAYEFGACPPTGAQFTRGNVDGLGGIDISDPIFLLAYFFISGQAPDCLDAGDANDDGTLDLTDVVYSLSFQFLGGDPPKSPFPACGIKEWINGLTCESFQGCR
jgi:hypothetical protein